MANGNAQAYDRGKTFHGDDQSNLDAIAVVLKFG
jgi:hypothetical protein